MALDRGRPGREMGNLMPSLTTTVNTGFSLTLIETVNTDPKIMILKGSIVIDER